mmetsp:Transcript_62045/g.119566  ORF Transcript_62045/g.119566 Transcript_62045/m.119566 type:complete len:357 (-) Transcript_62045:318-1388(-)
MGAQQSSTSATLDATMKPAEDTVDDCTPVPAATPVRARPQHRVTGPRRGALKHSRPAEPTTVVGAAEPSKGLQRLREFVCIRRAAAQRRCRLGGGKRRVIFQPKIRVTEFTRMLDGGGTVPGDNSIITLGLGRAFRAQTTPLAPPHLSGQPPAPPIEESAWVPPKQRERLLRRAMGDGLFFRLWSRRRREVLRIRASRRQSNSTAEDQQLMPISIEEANMRAKVLAHEVLQQQQQQQRIFSVLQDASIRTPARGRKRMRSASVRGQQKRHGKKKSRVAVAVATEAVSGSRPLGTEEPTNITVSAAKPSPLVQICSCCRNTLPSVPGAKAADATAELLYCPSCVVSGTIRASANAGA